MAKFDEAYVANFRQQAAEKGGDIVLALDLTPVEAGDGHAVMKMPYGPNTRQWTGVFAAGALISLADVTATMACSSPDDDGRFPFSVQLSVNLLRNTNTGTATAEARLVHAGRSMKVVETAVRDDEGRVLALVTSTHLVAAPAKK
jgi:1,4-dihydroxy-2-naphthoyl-CoA hydrolase